MSQELKVEETPATSIEAAKRHHREHGDMDGHTCLLSKCALHYPNSEEEKPTKPCPHKHTETIDFSHFTGKVYIRCKDCGMVLKGA